YPAAPAAGQAAPPAAPPRKGPSTLLVILGALGAVAVACIGLFATFAIQGGGQGGGQSSGDTMRTAVADGDLNVLIAEADESLAEEDGLPAAIAAYNGMLGDYPGTPRVLARLAMAYSAGGDWPNAEEWANQLIDAPDSTDAQVALGYALLADAYASQGDMTAALAEIDMAIENDPDLALGHAVESNLLAARAVAAGDTAEMDAALASLDRAVDTLDDEEPLVQALTQNALGYTFGQEHRLSGSADYFSQSEGAYRRAIELLPAAGLFRSNLAYLLLQDEDYEGARELFETAAESGYLPALAGIGWAHYDEGDGDEAEAAFDEAIAEAPDAPDGYFGMGRLRYNEGDYDGAIALLGQAVERNPRSPELQGWLGEALFWKGFNGEGAEAEQAFARAAEAYTRAIERDERAVFSLAGLAWTLQHQEQYAESVETFDRALALDPNDASLYDGKGWSLFNQGSYPESEAAFRQAIAQDDAYAEAHYHLGRALAEQGRADEARAAYQRALELDPNLSAAQEYLDGLAP
ncbi:MAG TPA: tetratricopeptide repeat protein, partial [Chloroflexaceae bacterium]|nr:tetratricopeptide repeat protein [Chloroflexaceae bacterium]